MKRHVERHFGGSATLRDLVIGMSDGLTVPFALAAGLSGAVASSHIVVTAGLAEIAAGAISMGLGGYLAGRGDVEHYASERSREFKEVAEMPLEEEAEVAAVFRRYGLTPEQIAPIVVEIRKRPDAWVDFMMRFELGLEEPDATRAVRSALTIGGAYALGGAVPLLPYFLVAVAHSAVLWSAGLTLAALLVFGLVKGRFTSAQPWRSGLQTMLIGALAAAAAYGIARLVS